MVAEFKAPPSVEGKPPVAARNDNIHPFWAITRLEKKDDEYNCILQSEHTTVVVACNPHQIDKEPMTESYNVRIPYITNIKPLKADEKLVLRWDVVAKKKPESKGATWTDVLTQREKRRRKDAPANAT